MASRAFNCGFLPFYEKEKWRDQESYTSPEAFILAPADFLVPFQILSSEPLFIEVRKLDGTVMPNTMAFDTQTTTIGTFRSYHGFGGAAGLVTGDIVTVVLISPNLTLYSEWIKIIDLPIEDCLLTIEMTDTYNIGEYYYGDNFTHILYQPYEVDYPQIEEELDAQRNADGEEFINSRSLREFSVLQLQNVFAGQYFTFSSYKHHNQKLLAYGAGAFTFFGEIDITITENADNRYSTAELRFLTKVNEYSACKEDQFETT